MRSKICGISDSKTLKYLTEHPNPPQYIGFIVNYSKSKRFVEINKLKNLLKVNKKNDKKRTMSANEAIKEGSDCLIIGRPITKGNPKENIKNILSSID